MRKISLTLPSPKVTILACCVFVGVSIWFWAEVASYLGLVLSLLAVVLTEIIMPTDSYVGSEFIKFTVLIFLKIFFNVGLFSLPALAMVGLCRKRVSDRVASLLVIGWLVVYLSATVFFRLEESI